MIKKNNLGIARKRIPHRQRGYLMAELALVLIISSMLAAAQFAKISRTVEDALAEATGQYMVEQQVGVNLYVLTNTSALSISGPVTGFANSLQPTVAELKAAGYLMPSFAVKSPLGLSFKNVLTPTNCPGANCNVSGYAVSTAGYVDATGSERSDLLGTAIAKVGIDGGLSFANTPAVLNFYGGGTVANPAGSVASTLAIRVGSGSGMTAALNQFYKLDGSRALTGTMNANNNNITGIKDLTSTGNSSLNNLAVTGNLNIASSVAPGAACAALDAGAVRKNANGTGLAICSGSQWQVVGNALEGVTAGGACSTPGQAATNATGVFYLCNGSFWTLAQTTANAGEICAPAGKTAISVTTTEQLVCKNGVYLKLSNLIAKTVEISRQLVVDGQSVAKPTCDTSGTAAYSFNLTQTVVDVSVVPPRQAMYITATDVGPNWSVMIRVRDNSGGDFSANAYSISAVMKLECTY